MSLTIERLTCEYQSNPLGIDAVPPRLSWMLKSNRRADAQTAYQISAGSNAAGLARGNTDLWNSDRVNSPESLNIAYAGQKLRSGQRVWWKVRVWDTRGRVSAFSKPAWFEMGLLSEEDWRGRWIQRKPGRSTRVRAFLHSPAPIFRKEFALDQEISRARAYVSGLGYYELRLNGRRVGDHVLDPGWTTYSKRVLYSTYDITKQLRQGWNAVGILLGNGWFNPAPLSMWGRINLGDVLTTGEPRAILQIIVEFKNGATRAIVTDETWRVSGGPILCDSVYLGEVYDARREQPGWDQAGFDDSDWAFAVPSGEPVLGPLKAQDSPPIRVTRTLKAVKLTEPKPGVFLFDFGQNFAGWVRLKVKGRSGLRVRLRSGELLYPDGTLNGMTAVMGQIKGGGKDYRYDGGGMPKTAFQQDEYVLKGGEMEVFTPRFTFHGFRYVEVTGFPGTPTLDSVEGLRLNADVRPVGSFKCSNRLLNRIQRMVLWTELSNLFSVQSDCPHREKLAYGGDIVASSDMGILNFGMARFYAKAVQDLTDAARPNGGLTETAPFVGICDQSLEQDSVAVNLGEQSGPIDYGMAHLQLLWQLYQYYGDRRLMVEHYDVAKRWIDLLNSKARNGILDNGISDHESLMPKPRALTGTAFYYFNLQLFKTFAAMLGKRAEARKTTRLLSRIKHAFNQEFLEPGTGRYGPATQTCQAFALHFGLTPPKERARALEVLLHDIAIHDGHLTTGIFGTKYMLNVLMNADRADVAYRIVSQRSFPGWGYMIENGATTLWEHWAFSDDIYSHNHPMFGSVSEWFYKSLAGIRPAPSAIGFDKIVLKPQPVGNLKWVEACHDSVRGTIATAWERFGQAFKFFATLPPNSSAVVYLPASGAASTTESGRLIQAAPGVKFLKMEKKTAVLELGSGKYEFTSVLT